MVCDVVGIQETRCGGQSVLLEAGYTVYCSVEYGGDGERKKDQGGVRLATRKSINRTEADYRSSSATRSTIGEGRGCNNFAPVLGGDATKLAPTGDKFDQPPSRMSSIRGKLADHLGDHVVLSSEGTVLATSTGTESLYPRPPQSLTNSSDRLLKVTLELCGQA